MAPVLNKYTCNKCKADFRSREEAKNHYTSKWHSYNLVKIFQGHEPISEEKHNELMEKTTYLQQGKNQCFSHNCAPCKKSFLSQGSYETHLRSKKHKLGVLKHKADEIEKRKLEERMKKTYAIEDKEETDDNTQSGEKEPKFCAVCNAVFASIKDYERHIATDKHKNTVKAFKMEDERKDRLDALDDKVDTADKEEEMEVDGNDEEWEDVEGDNEEEGGGEEEEEDDDGEEEGCSEKHDRNKLVQKDEVDHTAIAITRCIFCGKKSRTIGDSVGHMERQHNFYIPHSHAAKMEELLEYIGKKVGEDHKCMECDKPFRTLKATRMHMLNKPHHEIRFHGEYDGFFDIEKILAPLAHLPIQAAEEDCYAITMPNGKLLTHRDLRAYFKQRLGDRLVSLKRMTASGPKAITHLGKSGSKSVMEVRKEQQRQARTLGIITKTRTRANVNLGVKANKLQKHFRLQYMNAG